MRARATILITAAMIAVALTGCGSDTKEAAAKASPSEGALFTLDGAAISNATDILASTGKKWRGDVQTESGGNATFAADAGCFLLTAPSGAVYDKIVCGVTGNPGDGTPRWWTYSVQAAPAGEGKVTLALKTGKTSAGLNVPPFKSGATLRRADGTEVSRDMTAPSPSVRAAAPGDPVPGRTMLTTDKEKFGSARVEFEDGPSIYTVSWEVTSGVQSGPDWAVGPPTGGGFLAVACSGQSFRPGAKVAVTDACTINDGATKIALESPSVRHGNGIQPPQVFAVSSITGLTATVTLNGVAKTVQLQ